MGMCSEKDAMGSPVIQFGSLNWENYLHLGAKKQYAAGSTVTFANNFMDSIYYVKTGKVKQSLICSNGVEKVVGIIIAGNTFGEAVYFNGCPAQSHNIALENSVIYVFNSMTIETLLGESPSICTDIIRSLSLKIRMLTTQIDMLYSLRSKDRVYRIIYILAQHSPNGRIAMTHYELAQLAGVHRVTVSNALTHLNNAGIISCKYGFLRVNNMCALSELAKIL